MIMRTLARIVNSLIGLPPPPYVTTREDDLSREHHEAIELNTQAVERKSEAVKRHKDVSEALDSFLEEVRGGHGQRSRH